MIYLIAAIFILFVFITILPLLIVFTGRQRRLQKRLRQLNAYSVEKIDSSEERSSIFLRMIKPLWSDFTLSIANFTPARFRRKIAEKLVEAGNPWGMRFDGFIGLASLLTVFCGALFGIVVFVVSSSILTIMIFITLGGFLGMGLSLFLLHRWIGRHKKAVLRQLPEALDVLTISVEAGLSFDAALSKLIEKSSGPLIEEFARMLKEMSMGKPRNEAITDLGKRKRIDDLTFFTTALAHSDKLGVPIGSILRVQSSEIRRRHRQRIEFEAMQTPIKMIFPLAFCVFPALLIVLLAPAALMIMNSELF